MLSLKVIRPTWSNDIIRVLSHPWPDRQKLMQQHTVTSPTLLSPAYKFEDGSNVWDNWGRLVTLVKHLASRNLALRYRGSALGFLWSLLNPVLLMVVYTFVFRLVFQTTVPGIPYPVFFLTGMLAWNFVSVGAMSAAVSLLEGKALISKCAFPRVALPMSAVLSNAVNYLMSVPILIAFNILFGITPTRSLLLFPFALILLLSIALAVGLLLAALIPLFRDLQHLVEVLFITWFLLTPVLYPMDQVTKSISKNLSLLYAMNPMVGVIELVHGVFFGQPVSGTIIGISLAGTFCFLVAGSLVFRRMAVYVTEI